MSLRKTLPAAGAITAGLATGWAAPSPIVALVVLTVVLAAMNGYSKAYSP